jgi:hypothetical protein
LPGLSAGALGNYNRAEVIKEGYYNKQWKIFNFPTGIEIKTRKEEENPLASRDDEIDP